MVSMSQDMGCESDYKIREMNAQGYSDAKIASVFGVTWNTVKTTKACRAVKKWNTRAPILSSKEMEMLDERSV